LIIRPVYDDLANAAMGALITAETKRSLYVHPDVLARSYMIVTRPSW
jgi:hypothetical protein